MSSLIMASMLMLLTDRSVLDWLADGLTPLVGL
jgi:hypothetical protein